MSKSEENTRNDYGYERPEEFAFDLCSESAPCQIVVACVELKETLAATLDALDQDIAASQDRDRAVALGGSDVLLVPDMFWRFEHRFRELERLRFENKDLTGQSISVAAQDIQFRLDKSGAELWSEAWQNWESAGPQHYVLDRPFLVYLKKRDAPTPFFVMWIDNAELLQPWSN